jgi:hypothetical protein
MAPRSTLRGSAVQLTDSQWIWLEKYRKKKGLKSISEAVRSIVSKARQREK